MPRKSLRGVGADLYSPADQPTGTPVDQPTNGDSASSKATFYLSPATLDDLDRAWLNRRRRDRRISKSSLVEQALREFLTKTAAA